MGARGGRQVVVYDPHSSQRSLVYSHGDIEEIRAAKRSARKRWLRSCCCLLVALMVLLLVLSCLGGIAWLVLKPKSPQLSLQGITLHDLKVHEANGTTSAGNSTVMYLNSTLFIMATNTNRVSVSYSIVHLNITYNNLALDSTLMPPFRLQAHGNISIGTPLSVDNLEFFQADGQNLLRDAKNNHLPIRLVGQTTVNVQVFGIKSNVKLRMDCDIVIQYQDLKVQSNVCQTTSSKI
ncbi:hypothetical protein M758_10G108600 [Ceratodon purpureus]|nr:hypothetical protein M758_10G108600 [Ceratodon purpureus]